MSVITVCIVTCHLSRITTLIAPQKNVFADEVDGEEEEDGEGDGEGVGMGGCISIDTPP